MNSTLSNQSLSLSVLLVDDSLSERRLLATVLTKFGCTVTQAESGSEGLQLFTSNTNAYDLILLDVNMPGVNGYHTAQQIRHYENNQLDRWTPIMFISGRYTPEDITIGIESGGDDYLIKPVDTMTLKAKMFSMMRIAKMRKQLVNTKEELERLANTDELTKIANRRYILNILEAEISRSTRYGDPLSIAYMDIDHFKKFNDKYGHDAGDAVLKSVASTLNTNLRHEDSFGRLGGEEFLLILPSTNEQQALQSCERYRYLIESNKTIFNKQDFNVTVSLGLTTFLPDDDDLQRFITRADQALYQAKSAGRNCISVT